MTAELDRLLAEIRACRVCAEHLPLGPRPVIRGRATARILIASQAPGTRVHASGLSFDDASGDRLRAWLGIDRDTFYDEARIAIAPMGFCYPGRLPRGGDAPPRPECAPLWQPRVATAFARIELVLLIGGWAQAWHLGDRVRSTLTETVAAWRDYLPRHFPLPHPSWRNTGWLNRNPWFAAEALPELRRRVATLLAGASVDERR
ncbi:uracil-DNA glycosylase family protein [Stella sp.]|uniref:uracil-DNA glycosylase family protein n=1 Tax=Stella sp. TaxID=2912054 RepID=UPI0035ADE7ED